MTEESQTLLSIKDLEVGYTSGKKFVQAVNHVSFDIGRGQTLALVGETGAGKTTIAKSILRILPDPPAVVKGGQIFFEGQDLLALPEDEMLKVRGMKIAMIFQDPMTALNPVMKIGDQIAESLILHNPYSKEEAAEKAGDLLEMVGITRVRASEYPFEFSGGMKQRVVIAMALACSPQLLLADEPTSAVDVTIQAQILELIRDLREKNQTSMLLITHDLGVVAQNSDYVAIIYAGEIVEYANRLDLFTRPSHPYTIGLFDSIPKLDSKERRLKLISGAVPDPTNLPQGCYFHPRCPYATKECSQIKPPLAEKEPGHLVRCLHAR